MKFMCDENQQPNHPSLPKLKSDRRVGQGDMQALKVAGQSYRLEHIFLSLAHDYRIENAQREQIYFVGGKLLSPVRRLSFQNTHGIELALIRDKFLAVRSRFEVVRDGRVAAKIRQRYWNISWRQHTTQLADGSELITRRDDGLGECLCRGEVPVVHFAQISDISRVFRVIIHSDEDQLLMLAIVIAVIEFKRLTDLDPNP